MNIQKYMLYFLNHVSWSTKISVCSVKISVCSGNFSVWYTFSGKISVCSRFSRELGSPGSGFLTAWMSTPIGALKHNRDTHAMCEESPILAKFEIDDSPSGSQEGLDELGVSIDG